MLALIFTYKSGVVPPPVPPVTFSITWTGETVISIVWYGMD